MRAFVAGLRAEGVPEADVEALAAMEPRDYVGNAAAQARGLRDLL